MGHMEKQELEMQELETGNWNGIGDFTLQHVTDYKLRGDPEIQNTTSSSYIRSFFVQNHLQR